MHGSALSLQLTVLLFEQRVSNKENSPSLKGFLAQLCALRRGAEVLSEIKQPHSMLAAEVLQ